MYAYITKIYVCVELLFIAYMIWRVLVTLNMFCNFVVMYIREKEPKKEWKKKRLEMGDAGESSVLKLK